VALTVVNIQILQRSHTNSLVIIT